MLLVGPSPGQIQVNTPSWSFSWAGLGAVTAEDLCRFLALCPGLVKKSSIHEDYIRSHVIRDYQGFVLIFCQLLDSPQHGGGMSTLSRGTEGVRSTHGEKSLEVKGSRNRYSCYREARESFCNSFHS